MDTTRPRLHKGMRFAVCGPHSHDSFLHTAFALHCIRKAPHILAPAHSWQGPTQTSPGTAAGTLFRQNYYASLFPAARAISNSYLQIAVWQNHGTQLDRRLMIRFLNRSRPTQVQQLQSLLDSSCPNRSTEACEAVRQGNLKSSCMQPQQLQPSPRLSLRSNSHFFHKGVIRSLIQSSRFRPAARPEPAVGAETSFRLACLSGMSALLQAARAVVPRQMFPYKCSRGTLSLIEPLSVDEVIYNQTESSRCVELPRQHIGIYQTQHSRHFVLL
jgi:hypothetical protein